MDPFHILAILITLSALFATINYLIFKMPMTIGLMFLSLLGSLILMGMSYVGFPIKQYGQQFLMGIDFSKVLMEGMLGLLLFAGALHVNINDLAEHKVEIGVLSTIGVLASTFIVGSVVYWVNLGLDLRLTFTQCLLFGALISPTDPIAVMGILKKAGAPKQLETTIAGESLFNDGIGVVIFLVILDMVSGTGHLDATEVMMLFATEAIGGACFGLAAGYLAFLVLKRIDEYGVEVIITLALVMGSYALAGYFHLSGPIAAVMSGLLIGNRGRRLAMSEKTRIHLDNFWEMVDEILNAILFVLIGLEVLVLTVEIKPFLAGCIAVGVVLAARLISVGLPVRMMMWKNWRRFAPRSIRIMTWGGLRGGISVALALSIPGTYGKEIILPMTYVVVVFSILVQGLTIQWLIKPASTKSKQ